MYSARRQGLVIFALALAFAPAAAASTPVFGSVVAVGGTASDIALDQSRGLLYIANSGANAIDVMSTADNTIHSSIAVAPFPGSIALSADSQYLLVAHFCNLSSSVTQTSPACANEITSIHLADLSTQIFSLTSAPLGLAFLGSGRALVVTTTNIVLMDPASGATQPVATIGNVAQSLTVPLATFPGQILQAALVASADGTTVWGIASAGTSSQLVFQYIGATNSISGAVYTSSPLLLPRISTAVDGSYAMVGYTLVGPGALLKGRFPNVISSTTITGSAIDSMNGVIWWAARC
jgi:DNA-binding beta-propeller fold protein YncE